MYLNLFSKGECRTMLTSKAVIWEDTVAVSGLYIIWLYNKVWLYVYSYERFLAVFEL